MLAQQVADERILSPARRDHVGGVALVLTLALNGALSPPLSPCLPPSSPHSLSLCSLSFSFSPSRLTLNGTRRADYLTAHTCGSDAQCNALRMQREGTGQTSVILNQPFLFRSENNGNHQFSRHTEQKESDTSAYGRSLGVLKLVQLFIETRTRVG